MKQLASLDFYRGKWPLATSNPPDPVRQWADRETALSDLAGESRVIAGPYPKMPDESLGGCFREMRSIGSFTEGRVDLPDSALWNLMAPFDERFPDEKESQSNSFFGDWIYREAKKLPSIRTLFSLWL